MSNAHEAQNIQTLRFSIEISNDITYKYLSGLFNDNIL